MTMDKSLASRARLVRHRNVLSRAERIALLEEEDKWSEEKSVFGLPKVRNIKAKQRKAAKAEPAEAAVTAEGAVATPAEGAAAEAASWRSPPTSARVTIKTTSPQNKPGFRSSAIDSSLKNR